MLDNAQSGAITNFRKGDLVIGYMKFKDVLDMIDKIEKKIYFATSGCKRRCS